MAESPAPAPSIAAHVTLGAIFRIALYYGVAGFGGGYSVLAQLRRDLVERRKWVSGEEFLVLAELSKSLPGTPATSLLALLGQRVGGLRGGFIAAGAFLLPSAIMMTICGAAYSLVRRATALTVFFDGMNAAMVGVVAAVTIDLGRSALRSRRDVAVAIVAALLLSLRLVSEPILAGAAATIGAVAAGMRARPLPSDEVEEPPKSERLHANGLIGLFAVLVASGVIVHLAGLVRVFLPIGVMTFGGGLAMIPAIEHTVVIEQHWLDPKAFADAIALGQITPGPVAICATFIGYRVAGVLGALLATLAMFVPAIGVALAAGHSVRRFRSSPLLEGALRALAPAVIGMLAAATIGLARAGIESVLGALVALGSFALLTKWPLSPLWPLVVGGLIRTAVFFALHR